MARGIDKERRRSSGGLAAQSPGRPAHASPPHPFQRLFLCGRVFPVARIREGNSRGSLVSLPPTLLRITMFCTSRQTDHTLRTHILHQAQSVHTTRIHSCSQPQKEGASSDLPSFKECKSYRQTSRQRIEGCWCFGSTASI